MNVTSVSFAVYRIESEYGVRLFCFTGTRSFRFYEEDIPTSPCVDELLPEEADYSIQDGCVVFSHAGLDVLIYEDFSIKAYQGERLVLDASLYIEGINTQDLSLALKEGHIHSDHEFGGGGLSIVNDRPIYGLGERTGPLDKRGYDYINWNTDDPSAHVDTFKSLYQSIPFAIMFDGDDSVGVFLDNTYKSHFDCNKSDENALRISYAKGAGDYHFFVGSLSDVVREFTHVTGRNPLCPYWALGAQQSRWSYPSASAVDEVIEGYLQNDLPLSVVYLDIDYMDAYKDFTIDERKFPNIVSWLAEKKRQGIHVVPIIDAGVKAESGYFLYDEGMEDRYFSTLDGYVYHNEVWPGDSVFPAFCNEDVRHWWASHVASFLNLGFDGLWNDMNEPASFKGPLPLDVDMGGQPHEKAHNAYGHYMVMAGAEGFALVGKRLFQLTRAGYAGTCRYSSSWAGDNQSIYEHLRLSLPQMMNMSLSGQAYIGVDIGGFGGDATPELLVKWAYASLLNPLYRNHSSLGTKDQEPYRLKGVYLEGYRKALKFRYMLRPTLYTELYLAETQGNVPLRPLVLNYPSDLRVVNENTEMMLGEDLLLIPSLFPGERKRNGYFPDHFIHVDERETYYPGDHVVDVDYLRVPVYFRKDGLVVLEENDTTLRLLWGGNNNARTLLFEDDGEGLGYKEGIYNLYWISMSEEGLKIEYVHHGMDSRYKKVFCGDHEFAFAVK